jgi:POT family proton-dependent oligopeptide transporter
MSSPAGRRPPQLAFIIGNEACERFSYYGMRNLLTDFLVSSLLVASIAQVPEREAHAKEVFHLFSMGVYFFPLLGGYLADRFLGKYRVILWLSLLYCAGQVLLACSTQAPTRFLFGLFLIALGSGGIKPCVSAFVGDQFDATNKHLVQGVFALFYWIINFGSFFASLLLPPVLKHGYPEWAFGIPAVLMGVATLVFWLGWGRYVVVPLKPDDPHAFVRVCRTALLSRGAEGTQARPGLWLVGSGLVAGALALAATPWLGLLAAACLAIVAFLALAGPGVWVQLPRAAQAHPAEAIEGVQSVLRVLVLFFLLTPFFSLFDQKATTWILQAKTMALPGWGWFQSATQMQALNPALVMLLVPLTTGVIFPGLRTLGVDPTPLRRMTVGLVLASLAWVGVGLLQRQLDAGASLSILWQVGPYVLLTLAEVLVSATGLEFAYSQAPVQMKGVLMSFWNLTVTVGNLWVLVVNASVKSEAVTTRIAQTGFGVTAFQMFFFALFALVAALVFGLVAARYRPVDRYRQA